MFEQGMFADSLLESARAHRSRRSLTTLTSFGVQSVVVGLLLLLPILTRIALPPTRVVSMPISLGRRDPGPSTPIPGNHAISVVPVPGQIMLPRYMPRSIPQGDDNLAQVPIGVGDPTSFYPGPDAANPVGFPLPLGGTHLVPVAPAPHPIVREFRTSRMLQGMLIRRVEPVYPPMARAARVQGPVLLAAVISKDGTIENLRTISGHPLLVPAAISAVSQWRYRPYILNGEAIEVETQITVNFILGGAN